MLVNLARVVVIALLALGTSVLSTATSSAQATPAPQIAPAAQTVGVDVLVACTDQYLLESLKVVRVTSTAPVSARQGGYVSLDVKFGMAVTNSTYRAGGSVGRFVRAGGDPFVSEGPWKTITNGVYETEPASGVFSVWGGVGQSMEFHVGVFEYEHQFTRFRCTPVDRAVPFRSIPIEPPEGGGPITDEFAVKVVGADGAVLYERREFLTAGDVVVQRVGNSPLHLGGNGTYASNGSSASFAVFSSHSLNNGQPGTFIAVSDPAAGVGVIGLSSLKHQGSALRESVAGFAVGVLEGHPGNVGIYWSVRNLN